MAMVKPGGPPPRHIVTRARRSRMAVAIVAATGGSTNCGAASSAIANEAGINSISTTSPSLRRTPLIGDLRPGGAFLAKDVHDIGGVSIIIRELITLRSHAWRLHRPSRAARWLKNTPPRPTGRRGDRAAVGERDPSG